MSGKCNKNHSACNSNYSEKKENKLTGVKNLFAKKSLGIVLCLIAPMFIVILVVCLINIGLKISEILSLKSIILINNENIFDLSELVDWYITASGAIVTGVLSYFVLNVSRKSNEIADKIRMNEEDRENESKRENSYIVYYDIMHIFKIARELFISLKINNLDINQYTLIPSIVNNQEWSKNIALISSEMDNEEINQLYDIFERAEIIKELVNKKATKDEVINNLKVLFDNTLLFDVFEYPYLIKKTEHIEKIFCTQLREIVEQISRMKYRANEIKVDKETVRYGGNKSFLRIEYRGSTENGELNGEGIYINTRDKFTISGIENKNEKNNIINEYDRYKAEFKDGRLKKGLRVEFYDNSSIWYTVEYYKTHDAGEKDCESKINMFAEGKSIGNVYPYISVEELIHKCGGGTEFEGNIYKGRFYNGTGVIFNKDYSKKMYEGMIVEGKYSGDGTEYDNDGNKIFEGVYEKGEKIDGELISKDRNSITKTIIKNKLTISESVEIYQFDDYLNIKYPDIQLNGYKGYGKHYFDKDTKMNKWYEGEFLGVERNGDGIEYHKNGNKKYEGSFKKGCYHGEGIEYSEEGKITFKGEFIKNTMYKGYVYLSKEMLAYSITSKKNIYHRILGDNKTIYAGTIDNYKINGKGKIYVGESLIFKGTFNNGLAIGGVFCTILFCCKFEKFRSSKHKITIESCKSYTKFKDRLN